MEDLHENNSSEKTWDKETSEETTTYKRFNGTKPNWKSKPNSEKSRLSQIDTSTVEGKRKFEIKNAQGYLNKMTRHTFDKLSDKYLESAKTEGISKILIDQIFEQALLQPTFCDLYASLCVKLDRELPAFKRELLGKCQEEFQKDSAVVPENLSEDEKIEWEFKTKKRTLGNIKFISELYKNKMLVNPIIHVCIKKLLKNEKDEEQLESLCKLLTNVGSMIDVPSSKAIMDDYFKQMENIRPNISSRIRFMLEDTAKLRENNWKV